MSAAWLVLMGPQHKNIGPDQWMPYDQNICFLLNQQCNVLKQQASKAGDQSIGRIIDLSCYTNPPQPYFVEKGRKVTVRNPNAVSKDQAWQLGTETVAGYPADYWGAVSKNVKLLPKGLQMGAVQGFFYQVLQEHVHLLEQLVVFLEDSTGLARFPEENPRRRVVVQVVLPQALSAPRRFANIPRPTIAVQREQQQQPKQEDVTVIVNKGYTGTDIPAVYEWWCGIAPLQNSLPQGRVPEGHWQTYHPRVCQILERSHSDAGKGFNNASQPADVDGIRYMMQKVTKEAPFNKLGEPSRDPFTADHIITIDHPCFSSMDRATGNCFVQFQKGNPARRRPAHRREDAEEVARAAKMTSTPCQICFTEDGILTGCNQAHGVCRGCLRGALRSLVGDIAQQEHLICGCFSRKNRAALRVLAERADVDLQESIESPPKNSADRQDFEAEIALTRQSFSLVGPIPKNLYKEKVMAWHRRVNFKDMEHLYHPCKHTACADKVENWLLVEDFERSYQSRGLCSWRCKAGHLNSVLPHPQEIDEMNRNILLHPEYYEARAFYDAVPLRRYRLCEQCVSGGILMLAAHGGACKQWPGTGVGNGHHHCFCFACARPWNQPGGCAHGDPNCKDPGIQQVRINDAGDSLEVGYVNAEAYLRWADDRSNSLVPPPTRFRSGYQEPGQNRQDRLGLTNKAKLRAEIAEGTN